MVFSLAFANIVGVASLALASTVTTTLTTSTIVITPTQTIPSDAPQFTNPSVFTSSVLNTTNSIRNDFNATDVSWNQTLAKFASSYLASMGSLESTNGSECNWSHSGGPYGENIALGCNSVTGCINLCTLSRSPLCATPLSLGSPFLLLQPTDSATYKFALISTRGSRSAQVQL